LEVIQLEHHYFVKFIEFVQAFPYLCLFFRKYFWMLCGLSKPLFEWLEL